MVLTLFALGGAQCALTTVIALKTQKNEKKISKKVHNEHIYLVDSNLFLTSRYPLTRDGMSVSS